MLSYTAIARALNQMDGTKVDHQYVKRRMEKFSIPKEVLTDPANYQMLLKVLRKDADVWGTIRGMLDEVEQLLQENRKMNDQVIKRLGELTCK